MYKEAATVLTVLSLIVTSCAPIPSTTELDVNCYPTNPTSTPFEPLGNTPSDDFCDVANIVLHTGNPDLVKCTFNLTATNQTTGETTHVSPRYCHGKGLMFKLPEGIYNNLGFEPSLGSDWLYGNECATLRSGLRSVQPLTVGRGINHLELSSFK